MYELTGITSKELYNYCLLRGISHAMWNGIFYELCYESSWDSYNYSMNNSQGSRGTITFKNNNVFGAFRNDDVDNIVNLEDDLKIVPSDLIQVAKTEALQYLLNNNENGETVPIITTFLWYVGEKIYLSHSEDEFQELSGGFLEYMTDGMEAYVESLVEEFELTDSQLEFIKLVYDRKISTPSEKVYFTKEEMTMVGIEDGYKLDEFFTSFSEMNIFVQE